MKIKEEYSCKVCGKLFVKRTQPKTSRGIRNRLAATNRVTCSTKCSRVNFGNRGANRQYNIQKFAQVLLTALMLVVLVSTSVSAIQSSTNLSGYWRFDETTGTNILNSIGLRNSTAVSGHQNTSGAIYYAYSPYNESSNSTLNINGNTSVTINMWVRRDGNIANFGGAGGGEIFGTHDRTSASPGFIQIGNTNATHLAMGLQDSSGEIQRTTPLVVGSWTMITLVANASQLKLYINGSLNDTIALTTFVPINRDFFFFGSNTSGLGTTANLSLDEVGVWGNRLLNATEITHLYNTNNPLSPLLATQVVPANNAMIGAADNITINASFYSSETGFTISNYSIGFYNPAGTLAVTIQNSTSSVLKVPVGHNISLGSQYGVWTWNASYCETNGVTSRCNPTRYPYSFNYGAIINSLSFNTPVLEGSLQQFLLNLTYNSAVFTSISSSLIYNGITYAGTQTGTGDNVLFNATINVPSVTSNQDFNFYWQTQLFNGTESFYQNSSTNAQTVLAIGADDCSVFGTQIYNLTLRDEDLQNVLNGTLFNTSISVSLNISSVGTQNSLISFSRNFSRINPAAVCINQSLSSSQFRVDGVIEYSSQDRVTEFYYIQNVTLSSSNVPQQIDLYDLLTTRSESCLITFKDNDFILQPDVIIDITRLYVGEGAYKTVERPKTDAGGATIGHLVTEDVIYTINALRNNVLLATFQNQRAILNSAGQCVINLKQTDSTEDIDDFATQFGITYLTSYNDTSKVFTLQFASVNQSVNTIQLNISRYDNYLNESICSKSITDSSGTLFCTIPPQYYNSTAIARIYVDGQLLSTSIFEVTISKSQLINSSRYIFAFLLILTLPFLALSSAPMTILVFIMGLIFAGLLFLIDWGGYVGAFSGILWFILAGIIIMYKISNKERE